MAAPKGNQFWKARASHGRTKLFESADLLLEACHEYFQWVEDNPLWEHKVAQYQGVPVSMEIPKMRAMTIGGLCIFLDVSRDTWTKWKSDVDFLLVVASVEEIIRDQKLTGAAADLLNANIIAREIGLVDKREETSKVSIAVAKDMSPQDAARAYQDLMAQDGS
tara:strand:- start:1925 stop:2416 length:492 start_codon:yes stop_codon:yes gene_type:complete